MSCNDFNFEFIANVGQNFLLSKFKDEKTFEKFKNNVKFQALYLGIIGLTAEEEMRRDNAPRCNSRVCL